MSIYCNVLQIIVFPFVVFLPVIVLSVLLRFTIDDYPKTFAMVEPEITETNHNQA
jgi:hypothetical protein